MKTSPGRTGLAVGLCACLLGCDPKPETQTPEPQAPAPTCEGAEALSEVWSPARRTELDAALSQLPGEWPGQVLHTLDTHMAARGDAWRSSYVHGCEQQDRRAQRCLDMQLWELDAVVALATDDPAWAALAWAEIDGTLRDASSCEGRWSPSFDAPALPPSVGRQWSALQLQLHTASPEIVEETLRTLELDETINETPTYVLPVTVTRVLSAIMAGRVDEAATALAKIDELAGSLGPRAQMSRAQTHAVMALGRGDLEGSLLAAAQSVALAREQEDPWLVFAALGNLGRLSVQAGDEAAAIEALTEAVSLSTRLAGSENPHTADVQATLAQAQLELGQIEVAHDLLSQARDSFANTLGPDHPKTLAVVEAIAGLFIAAGRPGDAQYAFLDLLEIYGELYGPKDWRTAKTKLELGDTLMAMEQHAGARTMYMEALTPLVQALGADHRAVIRTVIHLGIAEFALGNLDQARVHCERGRDLVKALPDTDPLADEVRLCVEQLAKARRPGKRQR